MPIAAISALIKAGNLNHKTVSPPLSTSQTESVCCIPQQAVDSALRSSTRGRFLVLYRCSAAVGDALIRPQNASFWQRWDHYKGWEFEITPAGTVKYHGSYSGLEIDTECVWTKGAGEIRRLVNPRGASLLNQGQWGKNKLEEEGEGSIRTPQYNEYLQKGNNVLAKNDLLTYRFALYGRGDHVSIASTIPTATGKGTWRRLINEPKKSYKSTHTLYISLPELVGHIIACGVAPENVPHSLQQGDWGCVKLVFPTMEWKGPEGTRSSKDTAPKEKWKEGWWFTWRPGMEVWVC